MVVELSTSTWCEFVRVVEAGLPFQLSNRGTDWMKCPKKHIVLVVDSDKPELRDVSDGYKIGVPSSGREIWSRCGRRLQVRNTRRVCETAASRWRHQNNLLGYRYIAEQNFGCC